MTAAAIAAAPDLPPEVEHQAHGDATAAAVTSAPPIVAAVELVGVLLVELKLSDQHGSIAAVTELVAWSNSPAAAVTSAPPIAAATELASVLPVELELAGPHGAIAAATKLAPSPAGRCNAITLPWWRAAACPVTRPATRRDRGRAGAPNTRNNAALRRWVRLSA